MKKTNINITNNTTIEAHGIHTNGNCKKVYVVEKNKAYTSMTDAAMDIGCSLDAVSNVIRGKQRTCRGYHIIDLSKAGEAFPQIVGCLSEVNTHRSKTEISRSEMTEFRKWKAERKAEEKAQKRKAKREAEKTKLQAYIQKRTTIREKAKATMDAEDRKIMKAEQKLEALMDKEVQ